MEKCGIYNRFSSSRLVMNIYGVVNQVIIGLGTGFIPVCYKEMNPMKKDFICTLQLLGDQRWVGLWGFLWWAPSAKRKDYHGVSSGWSSTWFHSNTGLSSTQYEQIPIIFEVRPFGLTPFFFRWITFWRAYGWIVFHLLKLLSFFWLTYYCSKGPCFSVRVLVKLLQIQCVNWSRVFFSNDLST